MVTDNNSKIDIIKLYPIPTQDSEEPELSASLDKALKDAEPNWWGYLLEARKYEKTDPDRAEKIYGEAINKFPNNDAIFQTFAIFLEEIRKDHDRAEEYYKKSLEINPNDANYMGNYASFLEGIRKDYDRAEEYYKKSLEINPNDSDHLGNYASFLNAIRNEYDKAEEYYKKSIEINPNHANNLGNYAGFLLAKGDTKGFDLLHRASDLNSAPNNALALEILFYKFAHSKDDDAKRKNLSQIKIFLSAGVRSPGWILSNNVKKAIKDGHQCPEFLLALSKVVSDEEDITSLDRFDAWTKENEC